MASWLEQFRAGPCHPPWLRSSATANEKSEVASHSEAQLRPRVLDSGYHVLSFQNLSAGSPVPLVTSSSFLVDERKGPYLGAKMGALADSHLGI